MVFSSTIFLFAFLPLVLALYFLVPGHAAKNVLLLAVSLLFYAWGEPVYVVLMVFSIAANWLFGMVLARTSQHARRRGVLVAALVVDLAVLGFFKYQGFVADNINAIAGSVVVPNLELPLPIGISFFTLQAISYVIDVYRGTCKHQTNVLYLGMYIAMFPQLVAGPLVRYSQIEDQVRNRVVTIDGVAQGLRLFTIGLGKKVLLANVAGTLADSMLAHSAPEIGFLGCASGALAYTFQIYFDFSGYSDMAIGLGRMFGFTYARNFNYPYISSSVTEFWRRWHMSLSSFFRDYIYIPLGGNRVSQGRWMFNIMVVWGLTGVWHGAAWNFVLWGLYYGIILMCEKLFLLKVLERLPRAVRHIYTIVVFVLGWVLFSVVGLENVGQWLAGLFGAYGFTGTSSAWELMSWSYASLLPVFIVAATPVVPWLRMKIEAWVAFDTARGLDPAPQKGNEFVPPCAICLPEGADIRRSRIAGVVGALADVALVVVFVLSAASVVSSSYNPFIYFQF